MKRYGYLFEKIVSFENLLLASKNAIVGKKKKNSVRSFYFNMENEIIDLQKELITRKYYPRPYTQFQIFEPKPRNICSSDFRDRVVHHAICNIIDPLLEKRAIFDSYACRTQKGSHMAVARCQELSRKYKYYLKCDIKKYFESIDHEILKRLLKRVFKDKDLLGLLEIIINHKTPNNFLERGLPIGNLTSQHFANFYLGELDHFIKDINRIKGYVRYMDDFISFSNDKDKLQKLLIDIQQFVNKNLKLELKERATIIAPVSEGIPFLGFRVFPQIIRIKRENLIRMRKKIRIKEESFKKGYISEEELVMSIGSIAAHVDHVNSLGIRRDIFKKSLKMA